MRLPCLLYVFYLQMLGISKIKFVNIIKCFLVVETFTYEVETPFLMLILKVPVICL